MAGLEPIPYPYAKIRSIIERVKTIAMVGASPNWNRPSYFVIPRSGAGGAEAVAICDSVSCR
jgi:O-acetylhomoserine (thiol)-lyase